jgi:hypothetical protein
VKSGLLKYSELRVSSVEFSLLPMISGVESAREVSLSAAFSARKFTESGIKNISPIAITRTRVLPRLNLRYCQAMYNVSLIEVFLVNILT